MLLIYMSAHKSYNTRGVKAIVKGFAIYCSSYVSYVTTQIVLWKLSTPEIQMFQTIHAYFCGKQFLQQIFLSRKIIEICEQSI